MLVVETLDDGEALAEAGHEIGVALAGCGVRAYRGLPRVEP